MDILDNKYSMYKVFFTENGITSTSANHVCNKGKEMLKSEQAILDNINFIDTTASLLSGGEPRVITNGMKTEESFESMHKTLAKIANLNAMSAWIHEAIKAKNVILDYVNNLNIDQWAEDQNIELPQIPRKDLGMSESEVIGLWNVEKRNKYYALEAYCALVGKFIHPNGAFYEAKTNMNNAIQNPNRVDGSGRDAIVYSYKPSVDVAKIDNEYNIMATELRHKEAELNKMKQEISDAISEDRIAKSEKFDTEYAKYGELMTSIRNKFDNWKIKTAKEVGALKIYLPQGPKQTYDDINK